MKILFIEDDRDLGGVVAEFLRSSGHSVLWVQSRAEVPQDLSGFDAVVSDFNVPGGNFQDTKRLCQAQGIPLLLVSGNPFAKDQHENFIPKPFDADNFLHMVDSMKGGVH